MTHRRFGVLRAALAIVAFIAGALPVLAATRVDLVIDELKQPRAVAWPITTGVPFPRGALTDLHNCRLLDDTGKECLLQAKVAATWDAKRTSIRWLTIDFIAEPGRQYALEYGPDVRVHPEGARRLRVTPERVVTGAITTTFSPRFGPALGRIEIAADSDDANATPVILGGEHFAIDHDGKKWTSLQDGRDRRIVVESDGPVRACVRVDGFYTAPAGQRIVRYRTRYHFFVGLPLVKIVDEFRVIGSTHGIRCKDVGFALQLPKTEGARTVAVDAVGESAKRVLQTPWQPNEAIASFQKTYRHWGNPECVAGVARIGVDGEKLLRQGERAGAWMQVASAKAAVTGSLRWFWQQFPKEWEATADDRLVLHLWSPRGGELDFGADGIRRFLGPAGDKYLLNWKGVGGTLSPISNFFFFAGREPLDRGVADGLGLAKHHEFYLHFALPAQAGQGQTYARLAAEPPVALATGKWNCDTDVFGPLAARPNVHPEEKIVDQLFALGRQAQDDFGDYGWWTFGSGPHYSYNWDPQTKRHYADPRRFEYHTYQKETQLWWNYFRSGERKFLDWALPSENHWVDIAVSHEPTRFHTAWQGGERKPADLHWPRGDWSIDSPLQYVRHHNTGEAWLRGQAQYWASYHRTLETTSLAYYLTGDERFNEVLGYWRDYWSDLAGKTNASPDVRPWHREQAWFRSPRPGEAPKSWAELIRDYAPFTSGSRHQLTLFFNLATLYEHDWDPKVGQALRDYAAAYLDPECSFGVWRSHENRRPASAEAPQLAHFWMPALWKYARASGDPRMPDILRRYCAACLAADPFHEDVGIYSNAHIGYGFYFTKDPGHLRAAFAELERLRPHGEPLARPEDLGPRLYNPYAPCQSFTAVPRLLWALDEARRRGVAVPSPPQCYLQRTATGIAKAANIPVTMTLWGFEREPRVFGPNGKPTLDVSIRSTTHTSALQPFDRILPEFAVFRHEVTIPSAAPAGWYLLTPKLELAVLELSGSDGVVSHAAEPIAIRPREAWLMRAYDAKELRLESASPRSLRVTGADGTPRPGKIVGNALIVSLSPADAGKLLRITCVADNATWFRLAGRPAEQCWVARYERPMSHPPGAELSRVALPPRPDIDRAVHFVEGRFGKGLLLVPGRELHIQGGATAIDAKQGTIEFWVKRLSDDRLTAASRGPLLTDGQIEIAMPKHLPLGEWAYVAVCWYPHQRGYGKRVVHVYVNGLDTAHYRNIWWSGYGAQPPSFSDKRQRRPEFVWRTEHGTEVVLDELRFSRQARYASPKTDFGSQQTYNPFHFPPPTQPLSDDAATQLLFRFDGDVKDTGNPMRGDGQIIELKQK